MTPVDQEFMHTPETGSYGDCMRACVATLLDLPRSEVPHFYQDGCNGAVFDKRVSEFLAHHGLVEIYMKEMPHIRDECYHLMYGYTVRGTYHAVVARNGAVIHDPHPSKVGIIEDDRVGYVFLVRTGRPS